MIPQDHVRKQEEVAVWVLMVASQPEGVGGKRYECVGRLPLMWCKIDKWNVFGASQGRCHLDLKSKSVINS